MLSIATLGSAQAGGIAAPDAFFLQVGKAGHTEAVTGGLLWDWREWRVFSSVISGYWEVSLGRWQASDNLDSHASHAWSTEFGLTPVFRHRFEDSGLFVEAGIGAHLVTPIYGSGDKRFSTRFNFGDHLGLGWAFGAQRAHELALRYQHFSNGSIKKPNPGEDFLQFRYSRRLD